MWLLSRARQEPRRPPLASSPRRVHVERSGPAGACASCGCQPVHTGLIWVVPLLGRAQLTSSTCAERLCFSGRNLCVCVCACVCFVYFEILAELGRKAQSSSLCAALSVRWRRAGGSAAAAAAGPARTALNRFSCRLQSGVKPGAVPVRAAALLLAPLHRARPALLSPLAENEFEERDGPAWKLLCALPWICLLAAEVRSLCL